MNTRLQVEHPVTEMVTGLDLVREQLLIAAGEPLSIQETHVRHRGHAIECRIYAEDPQNGFLPDAGTITNLVRPQGPGCGWIWASTPATKFGVYYDPLIAKLIVWCDTGRRHPAHAPGALGVSHQRLENHHTLCAGLWNIPVSCSGEFDTGFIGAGFVLRCFSRQMKQPCRRQRLQQRCGQGTQGLDVHL